MSLNSTPASERVHIAFFGCRNAGKSSLVNAVAAQKLSVVSDVKGTTTDPVKKTMELLPIGPVVIIDTPGIDDEGSLGEMRVKRAKEILAQTDIAVLVVDGAKGLNDSDRELIDIFTDRKLPFIVAFNKSDLINEDALTDNQKADLKATNSIAVSALEGTNIWELKEMIGHLTKDAQSDKQIVSDLLSPGDLAVLVIPIDESAPKGRLILPQQQTCRDLLDHNMMAICCQDTELIATLDKLKDKPKIVITDSQAFARVSKDTPEDITLTSFSILFARYKGSLEPLVKGAATLSKLKSGDRVLISEGCTHHRQCNDIGTFKIPNWIKKFAGAEVNCSFTSGGEFPDDLSEYKLVIHCGGCMLNEKAMQSRIKTAVDAGVPIVNYGIAIAHMNGVLRRSLAPFPDIQKLLDE